MANKVVKIPNYDLYFCRHKIRIMSKCSYGLIENSTGILDSNVFCQKNAVLRFGRRP